MKKEPKDFLPEHSKAKIELLKRYLDRYLGIIGNDGYTKRIKIYDLFCNKGLFGKSSYGSPLVILTCVNEYHSAQKDKNKIPIKVDVHFNDNDSNKIETLMLNIKTLNLHNEELGDLRFSTNDYQIEVQKVIELLPTLKSEKVFLFVDPYGYKLTKASQIKALMAQKNAEVLLFLPTQFMYRFDDARPIALQSFIDEIIDISKWKPNASAVHYIEQIKEGFRDFMGAGYYVDSFIIQKDPQTAFCLFFFSSHIRGFEKMLESKWEIDKAEGRGWKFEKTGNLFAQDKNELEEKFIEFIKEKPRTNSEIFEFTLRSGYLPKHINEVLTALQQDNRITVITSSLEKARKGAFYINYGHYKEEPSKIRVKLS